MDNLRVCIGISPIYDPNFTEIHALVETSAHPIGPLQPTCVVFTLEDGKNSLFKLLRLLSTFFKICLLNFFLAGKCRVITKTYGIYPTTERPMVVFEMSSYAECYAVEKLLPERPRGFNGCLRLIITQLTKINPALGGIALVIRPIA